jgi:hypothetical protein
LCFHPSLSVSLLPDWRAVRTVTSMQLGSH